MISRTLKAIWAGFADRRFSQGVKWNVIGTGFTQGSVLVTAVVLARQLGESSFGEFALLQSTLATLTTIAQISTGLTATKHVAELRGSDPERAGRVLGLCSLVTTVTGLVATALLIATAPWLADRVFHQPALDRGLMISGAYVLFTVMNGFQVGALAGLERYRAISLWGAILGCLHLAVCWLGAARWGLDGALGGLALSALARWWIYQRVLRRESAQLGIRMRRRGCLQEGQIILNFAMPAALAGLTSMPALWLANTFLIRTPGGYTEMGVYGAVNTLRSVVLVLPVLLNNVSVSLVNSHKGRRDLSLFRNAYRLNLQVTMLAAGMGAAFMLLAGPLILRIFGAGFAAGASALLLALMAGSVAMEAVGIAVYQLIQGHGKMWLSLWAIALPRDTMIAVSAYFLTLHFGATGLAAAVALGCLYGLVAKLAITYRLDLLNRV